MATDAGPLGVLAGGGLLPRYVIEACRAGGRPVFVLAFRGHADPALTEEVPHRWVRLGAAGESIAALHAAGVRDIVLAGAIRRPSLAELMPDARAARLLVHGVLARGDDALLTAVVRELESREGFRVVAPDEIVAHLVAGEGVMGRHAPDAAAEQDIARGVAVVRALGGADVGQACVVQAGLVLGVEAIEGTDALLARAATLRREGPGGVLVKMAKPGQERRVDLPAIGPETITGAMAAGLRGVAVEAGRTLVLDRARLVAAADAGGLFVTGVGPPPAPVSAPVSAPLRIFIIAGEPSGDALGAGLMAALARLAGRPVAFAGVGGPRMEDAGLASLFSYQDLAVMGIAEVLPRAPRLLARIRETARAAAAFAPDAVVTIDSPGFTLRVAKRIKGLDTLRIHYVAPTVWAWRPGRAKVFKRHFDHLLALFPFEPPYFTRIGLATTFVGHPVVEGAIAAADGKAFRARHGLAAGAPLLCVLPGSRLGEVTRLLAPFGAAVGLLAARHPGLGVVAPTLDHLAPRIIAATRDWPAPVTVVSGAPAERHAAMAASDAALAASGTVALELAMARVPPVIAYKVSPLTAWLVRRLVRVEHANLVNILLGRRAVPEFIQGQCRPELLADALDRMLADPAYRATLIEAQDAAIAMLGGAGPPPSERAARAILGCLAERGVTA